MKLNEIYVGRGTTKSVDLTGSPIKDQLEANQELVGVYTFDDEGGSFHYQSQRTSFKKAAAEAVAAYTRSRGTKYARLKLVNAA